MPKASFRLPRELLEADRQAVQLCRKYQIMPTHGGVMLWKFTDEWKWLKPFNTREEAEQYLFLKLPVIEGER